MAKVKWVVTPLDWRLLESRRTMQGEQRDARRARRTSSCLNREHHLRQTHTAGEGGKLREGHRESSVWWAQSSRCKGMVVGASASLRRLLALKALRRLNRRVPPLGARGADHAAYHIGRVVVLAQPTPCGGACASIVASSVAALAPQSRAVGRVAWPSDSPKVGGCVVSPFEHMFIRDRMVTSPSSLVPNKRPSAFGRSLVVRSRRYTSRVLFYYIRLTLL